MSGLEKQFFFFSCFKQFKTFFKTVFQEYTQSVHIYFHDGIHHIKAIALQSI